MTHMPGGPLVFRSGYHHRKRTFKTHPKQVFPSINTDPNYAFLHVVCFLYMCPRIYKLKYLHLLKSNCKLEHLVT